MRVFTHLNPPGTHPPASPLFYAKGYTHKGELIMFVGPTYDGALSVGKDFLHIGYTKVSVKRADDVKKGG